MQIFRIEAHLLKTTQITSVRCGNFIISKKSKNDILLVRRFSSCYLIFWRNIICDFIGILFFSSTRIEVFVYVSNIWRNYLYLKKNWKWYPSSCLLSLQLVFRSLFENRHLNSQRYQAIKSIDLLAIFPIYSKVIYKNLKKKNLKWVPIMCLLRYSLLFFLQYFWVLFVAGILFLVFPTSRSVGTRYLIGYILCVHTLTTYLFFSSLKNWKKNLIFCMNLLYGFHLFFVAGVCELIPKD